MTELCGPGAVTIFSPSLEPDQHLPLMKDILATPLHSRQPQTLESWWPQPAKQALSRRSQQKLGQTVLCGSGAGPLSPSSSKPGWLFHLTGDPLDPPS